MKTKILIFIPLLSLLFFVTSCSTLTSVISIGAQIASVTGKIDPRIADAVSKTSEAIGKAAEDITPEQEYYIGRAVAGTILEKYKIYNSPEVTTYINEICSVITANSDKPTLYKNYYCVILDSDEINAFATSGGHILITRGLLNCTKSEDELAAVIAHEIGHIQLEHSIKAIQTSRAISAITATATTAVMALSDENIMSLTDAFDETVNEVITSLVDSGYSQSQEFDADKKALELMASAGYDPLEMESMLKLIEQNQSTTTGGFLTTHPSPELRISNLKEEYQLYSVSNTKEARISRFESIMSTL